MDEKTLRETVAEAGFDPDAVIVNDMDEDEFIAIIPAPTDEEPWSDGESPR